LLAQNQNFTWVVKEERKEKREKIHSFSWKSHIFFFFSEKSAPENQSWKSVWGKSNFLRFQENYSRKKWGQNPFFNQKILLKKALKTETTPQKRINSIGKALFKLLFSFWPLLSSLGWISEPLAALSTREFNPKFAFTFMYRVTNNSETNNSRLSSDLKNMNFLNFFMYIFLITNT